MREAASKWQRQADADLKAAKDNIQSQNYSWSCFASQQASEKYLKAFLFEQGQRVSETHSLRKLVHECADHLPALKQIEKHGKELDKVYFSTRYPDALPDDIPAEYYTREDAEELLEHAKQIQQAITKELE